MKTKCEEMRPVDKLKKTEGEREKERSMEDGI
jgi:hypothetical protein